MQLPLVMHLNYAVVLLLLLLSFAVSFVVGVAAAATSFFRTATQMLQLQLVEERQNGKRIINMLILHIYSQP